MENKPGLYVTATPIGNLKDITYRAVEHLRAADLILCEDTRQTAKLCRAYEIKVPLLAYHEHNAERLRPQLLTRLQNGEMICLVSDAGTPMISDPGYKLVVAARENDLPVFSLPGACAAIAALSSAGAPTDRFYFVGFPPQKAAAREKFLTALNDIKATLVFYETAPRLTDSLAAMARIFGPRRAAVLREITKLHEEYASDDLAALAARYEASPPKGELVVLVWPGEEVPATAQDLEQFLVDAMQTMSVKDAASAAADALRVPKKTAYHVALSLKKAAEGTKE